MATFKVAAKNEAKGTVLVDITPWLEFGMFVLGKLVAGGSRIRSVTAYSRNIETVLDAVPFGPETPLISFRLSLSLLPDIPMVAR